MDELLALLEDFECEMTPPAHVKILRPIDHPMVADIESLADSLLITEDGDCNWENIQFLRSNGYDVFPLEQDRFGWVVGGIETIHGIIAYG